MSGPAGCGFVEIMKQSAFWKDNSREIKRLKEEASRIKTQLEGI
tara:strand:- start:1461 stop:1592 length:132 start_codon:yes stop_codon:yes gene_type:complete